MKLVIGAMSVVLYGLVGASFWGGSWHWVGVALMALAVLRAVLWIRQLLFFLQPDED